jgi:hypothetical protein
VVNLSQLLTLDEQFLGEIAGRSPARKMASVDAGLKMVLGLGQREPG